MFALVLALLVGVGVVILALDAATTVSRVVRTAEGYVEVTL